MKIRFFSFALRYGVLTAVLTVAMSNAIVSDVSRDYLFDNSFEIPYNRVGVLLGTSPYMRDGTWNPFFANRVAAAVELYRAGRIDVILASGDNRDRNYNEPAHMRDSLREMGIPAADIVVDVAGYRTLDSVIRAGSVFGHSRFTVISQEFHNPRALYIARQAGYEAVAFNAADVGGYTGLRQVMREHLARTLAVLDVLVLRTQPAVPGEVGF